MKTVYPFSVPSTDLSVLRKFMYEVYKLDLSVKEKNHCEVVQVCSMLDAKILHQLYYSFWIIASYEMYDAMIVLPCVNVSRLRSERDGVVVVAGATLYNWKSVLSVEPESVMKQIREYFLDWGLSNALRANS